MVQELCCDRVWGPDHYFRHVLWGQGAQLVSRDPAGLVGGGRWPERPAKAANVEEEAWGGGMAGRPPAHAQPASPVLTRQASTLSVRSCRFMMG